jgi:hypothetical protein
MRLVWVKERWSDTVQSRGVYAGAFGARVGEERASQARWAGALWYWKIGSGSACALLAIAAMGRLETAGTQVNGGRAEGKVRCAMEVLWRSQCGEDAGMLQAASCRRGYLTALQILSCQMRLAMVQANRSSEADVRRMQCDAMCLATEKQQHSTDRQRRGMRCEARRRRQRGREAGWRADTVRERQRHASSPVFHQSSRTAKEQLEEQSPRTFNCVLRKAACHSTEPPMSVHSTTCSSCRKDTPAANLSGNIPATLARMLVSLRQVGQPCNHRPIEGCHRCRFTISFEEEASNFSAPKPVVQRYLLE